MWLLIESRHGRLWATPNDGPGATFAFSIPCKPDGVTRTENASDIPTSGVTDGGSVRIAPLLRSAVGTSAMRKAGSLEPRLPRHSSYRRPAGPVYSSGGAFMFLVGDCNWGGHLGQQNSGFLQPRHDLTDQNGTPFQFLMLALVAFNSPFLALPS